ncbi:alpha/beta hydrolase family protein [Nocardia sp. NPDC051750]|uniref:alpha/beta hydrolase family protein n=1 Tax=Nocardia sp. NPDC051750 TaxID=3364325 RepID=UPI0037AA1A26
MTAISLLRRVGALVIALVLAGVPAAASAEPVRFGLPAPTGSHPVGSADLHLIDPSRNDPWVPDRVRELMITVRYPARPNTEPKAPYMAPGVAAAVAAGDAGKLGVEPNLLDYRFPTHSGLDAPVADGRWPVLLYSPGATLSRSHGTTQMEQLASDGYIVVAIDHTHEAEAVEFPGGRVARKALPAPTIDVSKRLITTRIADTRFVLDQLELLADGAHRDADGRALPAGLNTAFDLSKIGMFGHSGGGFTTAETMLVDQRISAGADLDGSMAYSQSARDFGRAADEGLDRPFLLMSAGDHSLDTDASWQQFLGHHRGPLCRVHLPDGEHFSYTDYQILLPQLGGAATAFVGAIDPTHSLTVQHHTLSTFFGTHLPHTRDENRTTAPGCP